jgi:hypothetical protein
MPYDRKGNPSDRAVDNYVINVVRSGVYFYASGKEWYLIKKMKFITTKKKVCIGGQIVSIKVVKVSGVKIRVPVLASHQAKC